MSSDGSKVLKTMEITTADQSSFPGLLLLGTQSTATCYSGPPFPGSPALLWRIEGEKGVLEIRGEQTFAIGISGTVKIRLQTRKTGEVE
jgi:hypothetical protein